MPHYLVHGSASPEYWSALIKNPENRREAVGRMVEANGGKLESFYYAFGEDDFFITLEMPDNVSTSALAMAIAATGAVSVSTTVLITVEEAMEAMRKAGGAGYRPPS